MFNRFCRRTALALAAASGVALAGCQSSSSHAGFRFEYLNPPTVDTHMIVSSGAPPMGLVGNASYGNQPVQYAAAPQAPTVILQPQSPVVQPGPMLRFEPRSPADCLTLEDACARIRALESSRPSVLVKPEALPMPQLKIAPAPAAPAMPRTNDCQ